MSEALTEETMFLFLAVVIAAGLFMLAVNWAKIYPMLANFLFSKPPTAEQEQYSKDSVAALACGINSVASGEVWDPQNCPYSGGQATTGMAASDGGTGQNPLDSASAQGSQDSSSSDEKPRADLMVDCAKTKGVSCVCKYTQNGTETAMETPIKAASERSAKGMCALKAYSITQKKTSVSVSCEAAEIVTECTVKDFELPQDVSTAEKWIFTWGDPKFLVYFEQFPPGEDAAWNSMVTGKDILLIGVFNLALPGVFDKAGPIIKKIGGTKLGQAVSKVWETGKKWLSVGGKDATEEVTEQTGKKIVQSAAPKSIIGYLFYIPKQAFKAAKVGGEFVGERTARAFASAATKLHSWFSDLCHTYIAKMAGGSTREALQQSVEETAVSTAIPQLSKARIAAFAQFLKTSPDDIATKLDDNFAELFIRDTGKETIQHASILDSVLTGVPEYDILTVYEKQMIATTSLNSMTKYTPTTLTEITTAIAGMPLGREVTYDMAIEAAEATGKRAGGRTAEAGVILWLASLYDSKNEKFLPWGGTLVLARPMQAVAPLPLKDDEFLKDTTIVVLKRGNPIKKFYMASPCKAEVHLRKDVCQVKDWSYDKETNVRSFKTFGGAGVVWEHFDFWDPEYACPMNGDFASDCKIPCVVVDSIRRDPATSPNYCTASTDRLSLSVFIASQVAEWGAQLAMIIFSAGTSLPLQAAVWTARVATTASTVGMEYSRKWP